MKDNGLDELLGFLMETNKKERDRIKKKKEEDEVNSVKEAAKSCRLVADEFEKVGFSKNFTEKLVLRFVDRILETKKEEI